MLGLECAVAAQVFDNGKPHEVEAELKGVCIVAVTASLVPAWSIQYVVDHGCF